MRSPLARKGVVSSPGPDRVADALARWSGRGRALAPTRGGVLRRARPPALAALLLWTVGCGGGGEAAPGRGEGAPDTYIETGDMDRLRARGRVRLGNAVRARLDDVPALAWGSPSGDVIARAFAARVGLELEVVDFPDVDSATRALVEGRIDGMVAREVAGSEPPSEQVALSRPFRVEPGVFLARTGAAPTTLAELEGRTVSFGRNDGMIAAGEDLAAAVPSVTVDTLAAVTVEDVLEPLAEGEVDVTLVERWVGEALVAVRPELELGMEFGSVFYAAGVRASNPDLLRRINDFAFNALPVGVDAPPLFGDLSEIRERRVLRVLTLNAPSSYFVYRGDVVGFDLDLMEQFAAQEGLILQMVVAPSADRLVPWLETGLGDVIGVGVFPGALQDTAGLRLTRPYHDVRPVMVARSGDGIRSGDDVAGRTAVVGLNSPFLAVVEAARDSLDFALRITGDEESTADLLDRLEAGEADVTILQSHLAEVELADREGLEIVYTFESDGRVWATRADQPELFAALDRYLELERGGLTHAVLLQKYFDPERWRVPLPRSTSDGSLSPWDDLVQRYAAAEGFDWRQITAQMFVESRFDPRARSFAGAYGLMQMLPATAQELGVEDLEDPEQQIEAGVRYLRWLYDRLDDDLALDDRIAFSLAAYNAGFGHLQDARQVAERKGLDPDRWIGQVEQAMLSLSDPDVYRTTRYGYVRGHEPVRYVRRIQQLTQMYFRQVLE
ncbi:MAG: transporter substrate-binding domain-containing protein [Gemmatimonadota bacterium]